MAGLKHPSPVTVANEQVPVTTALRLIGTDVPEEVWYGTAPKIRCPFGPVYHSDGGVEATMRIYDDHAFCFSRCGYFTPVSLVAAAWNLPYRKAAVELLERTGHKPVPPAQAWAQASRRDDAPDPTLLAQALKEFCRRACPGWDDAQYQPVVAGTFTRCLDLLDRVRTGDDARTWLTGCKQAMTGAFTQVQPPR